VRKFRLRQAGLSEMSQVLALPNSKGLRGGGEEAQVF